MKTKHVQMSIGKLAVTLIILLITMTLVTTGIGLFTLHADHRKLASRHDAEAYATPQDTFDTADRIMYWAKQQRELRASHYAIADDVPLIDVTSLVEQP